MNVVFVIITTDTDWRQKDPVIREIAKISHFLISLPPATHFPLQYDAPAQKR